MAHLYISYNSGKGVLLTQAYGESETGGGHVALLFTEHARSKIGWSGRSLLGVDLAIADDDGNFLAADAEGEIIVRGPMVMKGYLNNPEETANAMMGDWLRTGDVGILDREGFLKVTGRKKDMLRSGGLNVYPAELERFVAGIRGLNEFAVIGVRDEAWGEVPMIVTNDPEAPDIEALRARCIADLAGYKRPKYLFKYGGRLPHIFREDSETRVARGVQGSSEGGSRSHLPLMEYINLGITGSLDVSPFAGEEYVEL